MATDEVQEEYDNCLISGDFDQLIEDIETNDETQQHFLDAVNETQSQVVSCEICGKKYKSRGGLKRHKTAKHRQSEDEQNKYLTSTILSELVENAKQKVINSDIYPASIRKELSQYFYQGIEEASKEFQQISSIYDAVLKNGDTEKFYGKFYSAISLNSKEYLKGLSQPSSTLLSTKVADAILVYQQKLKPSVDKRVVVGSSALPEREKCGLQYLGGYVLHNLHKKHAQKSTAESQQAMAILKAAKKDGTDTSQKLVNSLSRGGLWYISEPVETILCKVEQHFRAVTLKCEKKLDIVMITNRSITDSEIISNYNNLLSLAVLVPDSQVSKDTLSSIISLYVRVHCFTFAKETIQKYKVKGKQTKSKGLRKEISRNSKENQVPSARHE